MNEELKSRLGSSRAIEMPKKGKTSTRMNKKARSFLRKLWRRRMAVLDVVLFAAAAGTIYYYGEKIASMFKRQAPIELAQLEMMRMNEI